MQYQHSVKLNIKMTTNDQDMRSARLEPVPALIFILKADRRKRAFPERRPQRERREWQGCEAARPRISVVTLRLTKNKVL